MIERDERATKRDERERDEKENREGQNRDGREKERESEREIKKNGVLRSEEEDEVFI